MPAIGEKVRIRPAPEHVNGSGSRVLLDATSGRWLPADGADVLWSPHHAQRLSHGEIVIVPEVVPVAAPAPKAAPVKE